MPPFKSKVQKEAELAPRRRLLGFLHAHQTLNGHLPTRAEMGAYMQTSGDDVQPELDWLVGQGYVRTDPALTVTPAGVAWWREKP